MFPSYRYVSNYRFWGTYDSMVFRQKNIFIWKYFLAKISEDKITDAEQKKEQFIDSADQILLPIATTVESMHQGTWSHTDVRLHPTYLELICHSYIPETTLKMFYL